MTRPDELAGCFNGDSLAGSVDDTCLLLGPGFFVDVLLLLT